MKIHHVRAIEGANYFSYKPVVRGVVDISEWQRKTTKELGNFNERLLYRLPSLVSHTCSRGREGGFLERLEEGTLPGHVLEHVAIELLNLAGENIRYGKTRLIDEEQQQYEVIYEYECKEAAIEAFYFAQEIIVKLLYKQEIEVSELIERLKIIKCEYQPGPSTKAILDACIDRGIPFQRLGSGSLYQLGYGRYQRKIQAAMTDQTSCIGVDIAGDKQLTRQILNESAIPVPRGVVVDSEEEILKRFREFNGSVAVKPCQGNQGKGVSLSLRTENEVLCAFRLAESYDSKVIVEEYIKGNNYRLLIVGGKLVAAARRIPPMVIGDGKSSIKELVEQENKNPLRGEEHENYLTKIQLDSVVILDLNRKGLNISSVPNLGEKVMLRQSANLSTGATAVDTTNIVHPDNVRLAEYASKVLKLDIAGVDMILEDISKSYLDQVGKIIEVNAAPGLRMHLLPSKGQSRDIGSDVINMLFPQTNGRIPIISVTGTNGKTTVVRLIGRMLQNQNIAVGMTSTEGIFINGRLLAKGDLSGPYSAQVVLRHPDVQVAVLETARGGILRSGLGYDYADVAVITNITEDHLEQYGIDSLEDLVKVKSLVAEMVSKHSYVVLNADDQEVARLGSITRGKTILFSTQIQNKIICKHLALGGSAVVVDKNKILVCEGAKSYNICNLAKVPITWGGKAQHNVQNVLAATAACWALGYNASQIRKTICSFGQENIDNQGRLEVYDFDSIKVILDYGHNPAGIREVIKTLKSIEHRKIIGCIGLPGDRSDDITRKLASEAAKGLDFLYIKEDSDLRGRRQGEVADIIYRQALREGKKPSEMKKVLSEEDAFREAIQSAQEGDIVIMFYEKAEPLRKILSQFEVKINKQREVL